MIDPRDFPKDRVLLDQEAIGKMNPQRGGFIQLNSILHFDPEANLMVGYRKVEMNEFWHDWHLPGRPLLPGALMIETMGQFASVHTHKHFGFPEETFLGFGGVENCRFRDSVEPPAELWVAGRIVSGTANRPVVKWEGQILRPNGKIVASAQILGLKF
ncbi:MAG: hypothetical protein DWQ01_16045 [Planctomycetota bacterium]|nr:MAG: hypothetical protein DWQ01_16045 [Planctomycetota bacterium]